MEKYDNCHHIIRVKIKIINFFDPEIDCAW